MLFDTVHILKSIQYNWLNQHDVNQTFLFPESESLLTLMNGEELDKDQVTLPQNLKSAKLSVLKNIYSKEQTNVVKLAPNLTRKVLYPTSIERQNVLLFSKLFDEKTVAALKIQECVDPGTIQFMNIIISWWKIVNTKSKFSGKVLLDPFRNPIPSDNNQNFIFWFFSMSS